MANMAAYYSLEEQYLIAAYDLACASPISLS